MAKRKLGITQEEFEKQSNKVHNNKYGYDKAVYNGYYEKVCIWCPIHKYFWQRAGDHKRGNGCAECGDNSYTQETYIDGCNIVHNFKYDYSLVDYQGIAEKVNIICKKHNIIFSQRAGAHLGGQGCKKCQRENISLNNSLTQEEFLERARETHGDEYIYDKVIYVHSQEYILIGCRYKDHGYFLQLPSGHLSGYGCPKCSHRVSRSEKEWLDSLGIELERQKQLIVNGRRFSADGFDPKTNTIYEFNGDFWHGNPQLYNPEDINKACKTKFGKLYSDMLEKENYLKSNGFNVISIWDSEWKKLKAEKLLLDKTASSDRIEDE